MQDPLNKGDRRSGRSEATEQLERAIGVAAVELAVEPLNEVAERNLREALARKEQPPTRSTAQRRRKLRAVPDSSEASSTSGEKS